MDANIIGKFRDEIIESQKARAELTKWKVILVAAIGAAALGLGEKNAAGSRAGVPSLLALIPLACLYVDIVCSHQNMRMMTIGHFLRIKGFEYETFCDNVRPMFGLEAVAISAATTLIAAFLTLVGFSDRMARLMLSQPSDFDRDAVVVSAAAVLACSRLLFFWMTVQLNALSEVSAWNQHINEDREKELRWGFAVNAVFAGAIILWGWYTLAQSGFSHRGVRLTAVGVGVVVALVCWGHSRVLRHPHWVGRAGK
ncbi:MAG: hypothetical protein ABL995_14010 [Bryobacteraceae bacterium]